MSDYLLKCRGCGHRFETDFYRCPDCGGILETVYHKKDPELLADTIRHGESYWDYQPFFSVKKETEKVTLGEGGTPLVKADRLAAELEVAGLWVKNEAVNPSGTFKDRCMSISFSKARELHAPAVVIGSAGNAGAAAAAYAAHAGIPCFVMVPAATPPQRIAQILLYGAHVIPVRGSVTDCIDLIGEVYQSYGWHNMTTASAYNPFQADAEKAIAYELAKQMDWRVPDWIAVPVGGGGILTGIYKGFKDLFDLKLTDRLPRMIGTQESGCCPLVRAFEAKKSPDQIERVEAVTGIAVAIADAFPLDGETALAAIYESHGYAGAATDEEILQAQALLGRTEGVFAESASSTTVAVVKKLRAAGVIQPEDTVACVVTGSGLKELSLTAEHIVMPEPVELDVASLRERIETEYCFRPKDEV